MHAALMISAATRDGLDALAEPAPDLVVLDARVLPDAALGNLTRQARAQAPGVPVFIRIAPLAAAGQDQLAAMLEAAPDGIWLGDAVGRAQVEQLASWLIVAEAELGLPDGRLRMVASVETAAGVLAVPSLALVGRRLAAIALDSGALAREIGCEPSRDGDGPEPLHAARGHVVLAAATARVPAILAADGPNAATFAAEAARAVRDGFAAMLASGPRDVAALRRLPDQARVGRWMENFVSGVATK